MKLTDEEIEIINNLCLDDSTKIIKYLEKSNKHRKLYNTLILIVTILGAVGSIVAAITSVILLIQ